MTESTKQRPPEVDQALGRMKGVLSGEKGTDLSDLGLTSKPREYEGDTGRMKAHTDKVEIEVIVKPKPEESDEC